MLTNLKLWLKDLKQGKVIYFSELKQYLKLGLCNGVAFKQHLEIEWLLWLDSFKITIRIRTTEYVHALSLTICFLGWKLPKGPPRNNLKNYTFPHLVLLFPKVIVLLRMSRCPWRCRLDCKAGEKKIPEGGTSISFQEMYIPMFPRK